MRWNSYKRVLAKGISWESNPGFKNLPQGEGWHRGSIHPSHPATPGSIPCIPNSVPKIFSEENLVNVTGLIDGMLLRKVDRKSLKCWSNYLVLIVARRYYKKFTTSIIHLCHCCHWRAINDNSSHYRRVTKTGRSVSKFSKILKLAVSKQTSSWKLSAPLSVIENYLVSKKLKHEVSFAF